MASILVKFYLSLDTRRVQFLKESLDTRRVQFLRELLCVVVVVVVVVVCLRREPEGLFAARMRGV